MYARARQLIAPGLPELEMFNQLQAIAVEVADLARATGCYRRLERANLLLPHDCPACRATGGRELRQH